RKFISLTNHLAFHVQFSGTTRGFRGVHKFISNERFRQNATEIQPCRYSIDAAEGNIFSPQYPHFYPANANCTYFFPVRKSGKILLKLEFLDLRPLSCSTDYIDIYQMH
uniref:CUB domain-containing protein n=1 Tax=Parascaris univalens TaxID=6257 RepID=A0A915A0I9_PARUN